MSYSKALVSPGSGSKGRLSRDSESGSDSDSDLNMDTSDPQRKRQFTDNEGFTHPPKFAKVTEQIIKPVETGNMFGVLAGETTAAGPSGTSRTINNGNGPQRKPRKMPPIVARLPKVTPPMITELKNQTNAGILFEYSAGGLKIRTSTPADHKSVCNFLDGKGAEFYTFNPNPAQQVKFILRGLPPSMDIEEIVAGIREEGVEISHARQIKRNTINEDGEREVTPLPMWVITVTKTTENVNKLKSLTGIHNFIIRIIRI